MTARQSSQTVATTTPTTNFKEDNLWGKSSRFLFGNDVFISYARRDTTIYSLGLASELTKNELSCFLDQWGTPSGKELPAQLVTALKRSNMLILLGTKQAAASAAVATEIRQFKKTGRTIIPVSFDGALEQAEWYQELIAGISIAHESSDALQSGKASEHVIFSPDGKTLTTAFENPGRCEPNDACIQVWNVATRERSLSPGAGSMESFEDSNGVSQAVPAVYSPDGKLFIVFRGVDGVTLAHVVETTTGKTLAIFHSQDQSHIWGGAFSPDGKTLAIGHDDSTITLLDVSSLYQTKPSASPDSWDRKSKQFIRMLDEHTGRINTIAFSPDGKTIASASDDGTVRLWDTRFYQPLATFDYSGPVRFMIFSPDGSALITADQDPSIKLRRAAKREEVALQSR